MARPFRRWSIDKLEAEFDRARLPADVSSLERLLNELEYRRTLRAQQLKRRVVHAIGVSRSSEAQKASSSQPDMDSDLPPPRAPKSEQPRRAPHNRVSTQPIPAEPLLTAMEASNLLSAWIALEVLSPPQTYRRAADLVDGDVRRVVDLSRAGELPWFLGQQARPHTRLFYQIVVGAIDMVEATSALLETYSDEDIERVSAVGFTPIAVLTIDKEGVPVQPDAIAISSFAWGLPLALQRNLTSLGEWPTVERQLVEEALRVVCPAGDDEGTRRIDRSAIARLYKHLIERLKLPQTLVAPPLYAIRIYQWWKAIDPPDPPPMGSFFIADLAKAKALVNSGTVPELLARYLALVVPPKKIDIRCDDPALAEALAPACTPPGKWITRGRHPLVLLQQASVNLAVSGASATKLLPVNGPPGTGKTTLLRDLVVSAIVDRARAMAQFADPTEAFSASTERFRHGNGFLHYYPINNKLSGFEVVVASSNNRAVENISAELPTLDAIDPARSDLRYFKTVADSVARGSKSEDDSDSNGEAQGRLFEVAPPPRQDCWGLIAAVLGNAKNRYAFRQTAWTDVDYGLRTYLLEASGNPQRIEIRDPNTGIIVEDRKPGVVTAEKPPSSLENALRRWKSARRRFLTAMEAVELRLSTLEKGRRALAPSDLFATQKKAADAVSQLEPRLAALEQQRAKRSAALDTLKKRCDEADEALVSLYRNEPGLLGRLVGGSSYADWERSRSAAERSLAETRSHMDAAQRLLSELRANELGVLANLKSARQELSAATAAIETTLRDIDAAVALSGVRFADAAFFDRPASDLHRDTAWLDDETLRLREEVFAVAMEVHRAFVDVAAKQVRNNLDLLFRTFFGRHAWSPRMRPIMQGLWTTFFSVVPVMSTTFASVERMLGYLDVEAIGWLLIDEAGQAVPQAAIGSLMRAKRAVIVGDPIQLPPVTSLPTELSTQIAAEFRVDNERFVAPSASVQALADATSMWGTTIVSNGAGTRVGVPLVVHRRCAEPMFSLSNTLAYGGMMVLGRGSRRSGIREVLGPSTWIDVRPGRCEDKWSVAEGEAVLQLFQKLNHSGLDELDLYLISPFRIVAQKLRALLVAKRVLTRWTTEPRQWVRDRIGTVYTVQGREADTVIAVLGAAEPERRGARAWAGEGVNQLNVAVTRAKENLYVVGNRFEWASAGNFAHLERSFA